MEGITEGDDNDGNGNGGRNDDNDVADDIHIIFQQYNKGLESIIIETMRTVWT